MAENGVTGKAGRAMESEDLDQARLRKESAMARNWELRNQQLEGDLVPIADVERGRVERVSMVRNRLLGLPASVAPRLAGMDAAKIEGELDLEIQSILEAFSRN